MAYYCTVTLCTHHVTHFSTCTWSVFILANKAGGFKAIFSSGHKCHHDNMFAEFHLHFPSEYASILISVVICKWSFLLSQHGEFQSIFAEVFISTCLRTKFLTSRFRANSFLRKPGYVIRASTNIWWPGFVHHLSDDGAGRSARMDISLIGMSSQFGHSMTGKENYPVHVLTTPI